MKHLRLHPEEPIYIDPSNIFAHDTLGFKDSILRLAEILNNIGPPFTVAVLGPWGSGKTSFMRLLQAYIEKDYNLNTFWFDAWQYENESSLLLPFFSKLGQQYAQQESLLEKIKRSASVIMLTDTDFLLKSVTMDKVGLNDIRQNLELYEKTAHEFYDKWVGEIDLIKENFKVLINNIKNDKKAFVIFIDDLDRCLPDNVIRLMENVKNFLAASGSACIFIIGADRTILSKGIQARHGGSLISGSGYLEKFINLSVNIPLRYDNQADFIRDSFVRLLNDDFYQVCDTEIKQFIQIISSIGIGNPRRLRFLILRYAFFLTQKDYETYIREIIIKLIIYREFFNDAYKLKKEYKIVDYFPKCEIVNPKTKEIRNLSFKEIEEENGSCRDFAVIATEGQYSQLRKYEVDTIIKIDYGFNKTTKEIDKAMSNRDRGIRTAVRELIEKNYKRSHSDYFELIDFLFTLS
jgi:hypothetical protein